MAKRPMINKIILWLIITSGILALKAAEGGECTTVLSLKNDSGSLVNNAEITVSEDPPRVAITPRSFGLKQKVTVEEPEMLYRKVEVTATRRSAQEKTENGDIAFLTEWPCEYDRHALIVLSSRLGNATEVRYMWDKDIFITPPDLATAAHYYSQALSTAEKIMSLSTDRPRQYELIAGYLALRQFDIYMKLSDIPLVHSGRLRKIAAWHVDLLGKVDVDGLEVIKTEGPKLASEREVRAEFYKKSWKRISKLNDSGTALASLIKFKKAIEAEENPSEILDDIRISRDVLISSINSYAGKVVSSDAPFSDAQRELIIEQIGFTKSFLAESGKVYREKHEGDLKFLSQKVGFVVEDGSSH